MRSRTGFVNLTARQCSTVLLLVLSYFGTAQAQSTGTIAPFPLHEYQDNSGNPCNGCLLYTYASGTSTPLQTWTDAAMTVAHANPIVLNSAGRPPANIYLSATAYKFELKTSAGATLWTSDAIGAVPTTTSAANFNSVCDGRLSLTTALPVTIADVTAATSVFWVPYKGNRCALYDGSQWAISSFTELSLSLGSDAADTNYDVFFFLSSGTPTLERVAWANATTRATALTLQDGVYVKSSDTTKRYVGTYRTTGTIGQTEDSAAKRFLFNANHRVVRTLKVTDTTDSWTYTTATIRQARASTANQVAVVTGLAESTVLLTVRAFASNDNAGVNIAVGIGEDSTSTFHASCVGMNGQSLVVNLLFPASAQCAISSAVGYHFYSWNEWSAATGTTTWRGDAGITTLLSGMSGSVIQ